MDQVRHNWPGGRPILPLETAEPQGVRLQLSRSGKGVSPEHGGCGFESSPEPPQPYLQQAWTLEAASAGSLGSPLHWEQYERPGTPQEGSQSVSHLPIPPLGSSLWAASPSPCIPRASPRGRPQPLRTPQLREPHMARSCTGPTPGPAPGHCQLSITG